MKEEENKIKMLLDVPINLTVELGRKKILINDILNLEESSFIELDKIPGDEVEIYVNNKLFAMGEMVVVKEKIGVRITDIFGKLS